MPGFSSTLKERKIKKWGKMGGGGSGSLVEQRRPIAEIDNPVNTTPTSFPTEVPRASKKSKRSSKINSKRKKSGKRKKIGKQNKIGKRPKPRRKPRSKRRK